MMPERFPRLTATLLVAAGLCVAVTARCAPWTTTRATLPNGLEVVLAPDTLATAIDAALWFPAGSRNEKPTQSGLALLAARSTFRNGSDSPLSPLASAGGDGTLIATSDYTSFLATVPPDALDRALSFLSERTAPRASNAAELAAERASLRADGERSDRAPVARAIARLWAAAWPGHAYANTGAVPTTAASAITPADIDGWRRTRLSVSQATLTLTGAFDPDSAMTAVRRAFGGRAKVAAPAAPAAMTPRAGLRARDRMELPVRLCLVGWRAPGAADPDAAALEMLAAWLGGQPKARLGRVLTDDWKLAVATQAGFVAQKGGSLLWTMAAVAPDADSGAVETTLLDAVTGVARTAPDARELELARRQAETSAWFALQTMRQRGQALGEAAMLAGDADAAARRLEALRRVTPADVQRAAARVMTDAGRAILWVSPADDGGAR